MNRKKTKKSYNLEYIEKLFKIIPLVFIFILMSLSILITYFILDSKKTRDIDLLLQNKKIHFEFDKKEKLQNFVNEVKKDVDINFDILKTNLKKNTYRIIGNLDYLSSNPSFSKKLTTFLKDYENKFDVNVSIFEKNKLHILYGKENINYLQEHIFGESNKSYEKLVLQYIYSQGKTNLQSWKNDLKGTLRLSFFDTVTIENKEYFVGTFSKVENLKYITKNVMIDKIKQLRKNIEYDIWLLDLTSKESFNYFNNDVFVHAQDIGKTDKTKNKNFEILKYYINSDEEAKRFEKLVYYDSLYDFLLIIDYDFEIEFNSSIISSKYNQLFLTISTYTFFISVMLILFSFLFSSFIKNILDKYKKILKEKTDSLTHWKKRFELAIIASNDGLWDIDFSTNKIYFSNKWLEISGYHKDEITTFSDWFSLIHNEEKNSVELLFEKIFANESETFISEYRLKTKNEGYKWILARGRVFIDKQTNERRMLMMSMDIDKSKRLKKELLDVELLVEDGKIVIFKLNNDENLSVKYISNSVKNYGYTKEEFEKHRVNFLDLIYKEDLFLVKAAINAALKKDLTDFSFVCRILNAANEIRWISCRTILIKNHSGEVINFYGYINDITKIKMSEEELKLEVALEVEKNIQKDRLLIQQSKLAAMGEMIGAIAHQWRQPLNLVFLFLQFLRDNYQKENIDFKMIDKYFKRSFTQIEYMSQTIDDFRNFYKPSKTSSLFFLKNAIESTYEIIKVQLKDENIKVTVNCSEEIEINTYENELKQSLLNILNNAKDAIITKKKEEKFDAYIDIDILKHKDYVSVNIKNNGEHIAKDIINRIFEPYFTTKFETQGTGIGLYMTKTIIETNMKGKIEVENFDDGVVFIIKLPLDTGKKDA